MLSAQGDLQRLLSSFFARPIVVSLVYSNTTLNHSKIPSESCRDTSVSKVLPSPSTPVIQTRQVHLLCSGYIVCTATSTVRITSPECARLFLEEKYAIGQVFMEFGRLPRFELMNVGVGKHRELWREYKLEIEGFECEILEVFPDRKMFKLAEKWFHQPSASKLDPTIPRNELVLSLLAIALIIIIIYL